jgi:nucleoside-diphosphate-sugar epimerase
MHLCIPEIRFLAIPFSLAFANNGAVRIPDLQQLEGIAMSSQRTALILGAHGGFGNEVMRSLLRHGWRVRALVRSVAPDALQHAHLEWLEGDALIRQDVIDAACNVNVIVHAVNPANYHNWRGLVLPMLDNTIAAANNVGARVVLPGTLYNYGIDALPLIDEDAPQTPQTRKGAIRVEMEERLRDACWDGRMRALIVRCGDFFGPRAGNSSWLAQAWVTKGHAVRFVLNPGRAECGHSWAYLPDVAETVAQLLSRENALQKFDAFHFKGHWLTNADMASAICDAAGISRKRVLRFPWWAIRATAFLEVCREMLEMRYLWDRPAKLDNHKLIAQLGAEPHTPIAEAVRSTLFGIGSMNPSCAFARRAKNAVS